MLDQKTKDLLCTLAATARELALQLDRDIHVEDPPLKDVMFSAAELANTATLISMLAHRFGNNYFTGPPEKTEIPG